MLTEILIQKFIGKILEKFSGIFGDYVCYMQFLEKSAKLWTKS